MGLTWIAEKGNTLWKVGVFEGGEIVSKLTFETFDSEAIPQDSPQDIMLTGSGHWSEDEESAFYDLCNGNLFVFKHGDGHPLVTQVYNPESLGTDRVANSYAVQRGIDDYMRVNPAWLVVDVGTCVTADLIVEGVHLGGSISPGIQSRLNVMNRDTYALPHLEFKNDEKAIGLKNGCLLRYHFLLAPNLGAKAYMYGYRLHLTPNLNRYRLHLALTRGFNCNPSQS